MTERMKPDERKWPAGCIKPNSCARNMSCMYLKCPHGQNETLRDDIRKAVQTAVVERALTRANNEQPVKP